MQFAAYRQAKAAPGSGISERDCSLGLKPREDDRLKIH